VTVEGALQPSLSTAGYGGGELAQDASKAGHGRVDGSAQFSDLPVDLDHAQFGEGLGEADRRRDAAYRLVRRP